MNRIVRFMAAAALLLPVASLHGQEPQAGLLLYSDPGIDDPNFERTVLVIVHHDDDGTIALALNRPTWIVPAEAFPAIAELTDFDGRLFFGGPNTPNQPLLMYESDAIDSPNARRVIGSVFVTTDIGLLNALQADPGAAPPRVRLFAGHAAWVPGQLEDEIANGAWDLAPARVDQVFAADPADLWQRLPTASDAATAALR